MPTIDAEVWARVGERVCERIQSIGANLEEAAQYLGQHYPIDDNESEEKECSKRE